MFYSHQLLARKAPLGQIWMAATMHQKINRRNLDKLNIIKICEEILNPSVPMALRLSGILMGGVVIVYERKVKLLYDDVNRLLVEINQAWKVKAAPDPTVLPKGKSQAKYEAVTLREKQEAELGETEQSLSFIESATMRGFQQTTFISMRLDDMDEQLFSSKGREEEERSHHYHQADTANITLSEHFDTYQTDTDLFNRFERFDIEGDEDTHMNITPPNPTEIPSTLIPSPEIQPEPSKPDEIPEQHPEDNINQQSDEVKEANQPQRVPQRRPRRVNISTMDYQQTVLPGPMYQSWLRSASDLIGRKRKHTDAVPAMKIPKLMELPSLVLIDRLFVNGTGEIHYSPPLLKLSMISVQPQRNSPTSRASPPPPSSSASPPERNHHQDPVGFAFEDVQDEVEPQSREKQRAVVEEPNLHFVNQAVNTTDNNVITTPGNSGTSGTDARSIPSSGSGHGHVSNTSADTNSGRLKRKQFSSPRIGSVGLDPVTEERSWQDFELAPENDLIVETGPTQTQKRPIIDQQIEQLTDSIRKQLKMHFETPGSTEVVSLNQMADGMNKKRAACLFYQTCVLATRGFARVKQKVPYGDIFISRGVKM